MGRGFGGSGGPILPVFAAVAVIILLLWKLYLKIRPKFPIKVNCWFCNTNTSVPYNSSNSWYCPQCDQYNGFWPDGSYNRILQEQYNEKLNCGSWSTRVKQTKINSNGLCRFCNINLELKVQQLAQFVPFNKDNHDEEVQQYSDKLERVYRLCSHCQAVLKKTLQEKYKTYVTEQYSFSKTTLDASTLQCQPRVKERHPVYLCVSTVLSLGLLMSTVPYQLLTLVMTEHSLPDYMLHVVALAQQFVPNGVQSSIFYLAAGVLVHVFDLAVMRHTTALVNLLLWAGTLSVPYVPVEIESHIPNIFMLASVVFFMTSVCECRGRKTRSIAAVKPVQLQKLDGKTAVFKKKKSGVTGEPSSSFNIAKVTKSSVSDPKDLSPVPSPSRELTPEDFGLGKLNVSPRRVTRSQTRHFQTKTYNSQYSSDIFRQRTVHLSPPKLQVDKSFDFPTTLTRSSSQSSGFVSLSHQKYLDESRSPSVVGEDLESISQLGGNALTHYPPSPLHSPIPFSSPYTMPFPHFAPQYSIMHYTPAGFNKYYQFSQMAPYQPSLDLSTISIPSTAEKGWFQMFKTVLSSSLFIFLITSNVAVLWKVFGEDYFNMKT